MSKQPRTMVALRRWLKEAFDDLDGLCRYGTPDCVAPGIPDDPEYFDRWHAAEIVEEANRYACRFGGGGIVGPVHSELPPRDGLAAIGRLLAWCEESLREDADLLTVEEVANKLDTSVRSVWRLRSSGEIPQPISVGGLTKWRRSDIEEWVNG